MKKILLIEDQKSMQHIIAFSLKKLGFSSEAKDNGKLGVEHVKEKGISFFDAIICDIEMPVMNGLQATKSLRAMG